MTTTDKIKNATLKTKVLGILIILIVAVICVSFIFPLAIDPSTFTDPVKRSQWIVNTLLLTGLVTIGMTLFGTIATDMIKNKEKGRYQTSLLGYMEQRETIRPYDREFPRWKKSFDVASLRRAEIDYLLARRIEKPELIVDNLDKINPVLLCDHQEKTPDGWIDVKGKAMTLDNGVTILALDQDQAEAIMEIKQGKVKIHPFPANYYLTVDSMILNVSQVNKADSLMRAKKENQTFTKTFRIVKMLLTSSLMAMITVKDFSNLSNAEAWYMLISRLLTFASGMVAGWMSADTDVKFDVDLMNDRTKMLSDFGKDIASGKFVIETYEERARKEAEDDRRREEEKAELSSVLHAEGDAGEPDSTGLDGKPNQTLSVQRV